MKIVIRHAKDGSFLGKDGDWAINFEAARIFTTSNQALDYCHHNGFEQYQILMKNAVEQYDVVVFDSREKLPLMAIH
jgi:hypothetical protein